MRGVRASRICPASRKAQVTLFIAIGIVAVIFVGLIYFFMRSSPSDDPQKTVSKLAENSILEQYLGSCLDTSVNSEFKKVGDSGGIPYGPPYSTGYPYAIIGNGTSMRKVMYGLIRNTDVDKHYPLALLAPDYPAPGIGIANSTINAFDFDDNGNSIRFYSFQDGYFGDVTFPATCEREGINAINGQYPCAYYVNNPPMTKGPSIQKYLSESIIAKVQQCASVDVFNKNTGLDLDSIRASNVNITFTQDKTLMTFRYDITQQNKTYQLYVTRRYPVRMMPIADFAFDIAREDSKNATFKIASDYHNLRSYREGFSVFKTEYTNISSCEIANCSNKASLVTIIDSKSMISNAAFTYSFLIEHRAPMLDEMDSIHSCNTTDGMIAGIDPDDSPVEIIPLIRIDTSSNFTCTSAYGIVCTKAYAKCTVKDVDGETDWKEFEWEKILVSS